MKVSVARKKRGGNLKKGELQTHIFKALPFMEVGVVGMEEGSSAKEREEISGILPSPTSKGCTTTTSSWSALFLA